MKKYLVCLMLFLASSSGNFLLASPMKSITPINSLTEQYFTLTRQDIEFKDRTYRLFIAVPKKTPEKPTALYLLDGNAQFPLAVNAVDTDKPLPLIIGIGYATDSAYDVKQRTRDYTVPASGDEFSQGGKAKDFLQFIQQQAIPYINRQYSPNPHQQHFFGHSFGALFGLYVLLQQPDLFQHYTLASPSLWWGNGSIIPNEKPWIKKPPTSLLITLGEYEENPEKDPKITAERLNKIKTRQQIYSTRAFADELKKQGTAVEFRLIKQKGHGDSIPNAIQQAVNKTQRIN